MVNGIYWGHETLGWTGRGLDGMGGCWALLMEIGYGMTGLMSTHIPAQMAPKTNVTSEDSFL